MENACFLQVVLYIAKIQTPSRCSSQAVSADLGQWIGHYIIVSEEKMMKGKSGVVRLAK